MDRTESYIADGKRGDTTQRTTGGYFLCCQRILQDDTLHRCTIKLGTTGIITGFDIDTTHFDGMPMLSLDIGPELDGIAT
jgi:hypothetical protein